MAIVVVEESVDAAVLEVAVGVDNGAFVGGFCPGIRMGQLSECRV